MHQLSAERNPTTLITPLEQSDSRFLEGGMYLAIIEPREKTTNENNRVQE